jgi:hypothetical protein
MRAETLARAERALRDPSRTRIVARARIKVPAQEDEAPAVRTLEDALGTAEFDDCGRLVVVRCLVLPRFPVRASSAWVARAIEAAWRAQAAYAVNASAAEAPSARAVYFRDVTEARVILLQALSAGASVDAWFWPLAVPELAPGAPRNEAMVRVLTAMVCEPGSTERSGLSALGACMMGWSARQLRALLDALPTTPPAAFAAYADGVPAANLDLESAGPFLPASADAVRGTAGNAVRLVAGALGVEPRLAGSGDWRCAMLANSFLRANAPLGTVPAPHVVREVLRAAAQLAAASQATPRSDHERLPVAEAQAPEETRRPADPQPEAEPLRGDSLGGRSRDSARALPDSVAASRVPASTAAPLGLPTRPWLEGATATRFGGLLLVLNVLNRLGIDAWLALQAPKVRASFVIVLLAEVAQRLRIPSDDPHWELLVGAPELRAALRDRFWQWRGFGWPVWTRPEPVIDEAVQLDRSISLWIRALRGFLRRRCSIGLATLARRDAWLSVTPTHVDVVFALSATDLRVRRAGLDSDSGWLPWFGRIVALHFIHPQAGSVSHA